MNILHDKIDETNVYTKNSVFSELLQVPKWDFLLFFTLKFNTKKQIFYLKSGYDEEPMAGAKVLDL